MRILTFVDRYLPGYKAGGPLRTISNLVAQMPAQYEFYVVTRDRDAGDRKGYPGIVPDRWNKVGRAQVMYLSPRSITPLNLATLVRETNPDVVYTNSLFSRMNIMYLLVRRLALAPHHPFILAPRGELSPGALCLKGRRKHLFLWAAGRGGLLRRLTWQASTLLEREEILGSLKLADACGSRVSMSIAVAQDPAVVAGDVKPSRPAKKSGSASFVFISRVDRKKNLVFGINLLAGLQGDIHLDVFGPVADEPYWRQCLAAIAELPKHVHVRYAGAVPHEEVAGAFAGHHFFLFPTLGENFGHVVLESLSAGCPVLISDATPWKGLDQRGCGWVLPLADRNAWDRVLQRCVDMNAEEYADMTASARRAAEELCQHREAIAQNVQMFDEAVAGWRPDS